MKLRTFIEIGSAVVAYCVFVVAVFWDSISNYSATIQWDAVSVHFSNLFFSSRLWHEGIMPLWTPYLLGGFPQIADLQVAIFYPINLLIGLFRVFTPQLVLFQIVIHYIIAGVGTFLLARHFSKNYLFSLGAGLAFAFGGFMIGHASHLGMQNTIAWLPFIFFLLLKTLEQNRFITALWCGFFLGVAFLAGHFQMSLYVAFAIGAYWLYDLITFSFIRIWRHVKYKEEGVILGIIISKIISIVVIFAVAAGIAAIQLAPTFELSKLSQRSAIPLEVSQTESLKPSGLRALVVPNYKNVAEGTYLGQWDRTQHYLFLSIAILFLAFLGLATGVIHRSTRKNTIFFIILGLLALEYSFGKYAGFQKLFYDYLPFFDKVRAPANMMALFNLSVIVLASIFVHNAEHAFEALKKPRERVWFGLIIALVIATELFRVVPNNELLYARRSSESVTALSPFSQQVLKEYEGKNELEKFSIFGISDFADNSPQQNRIYNFDGYNPLEITRHAKYVDAMAKNTQLVDLAGIKYIPCEFIASRIVRFDKQENVCINDKYFPRAFFVDSFEIANNEAIALERITQVNLRETAIIEGELPTQDLKLSKERGNINVIDFHPGYWKLETTTNTPQLLVFVQTNYPGWQATIDGKETPINQTDYLFQSIFVPAGTHEAVFVFHSPKLMTGAIITGITLALLAIFSLMTMIGWLLSRRFQVFPEL